MPNRFAEAVASIAHAAPTFRSTKTVAGPELGVRPQKVTLVAAGSATNGNRNARWAGLGLVSMTRVSL
jgi:hypothetical protein